MRMIVDLGDFDQSVKINSTGVSGHPGSPWYEDQMVPWAKVEYIAPCFGAAKKWWRLPSINCTLIRNTRKQDVIVSPASLPEAGLFLLAIR